MSQFSSVQLLSCVWLFATPWTAACQASLSITNSRSPPKPMCIESVMPSNHLILCRPLLFLPSIFPSIRVFSNKSALHIRCPKDWSFSFNSSPSNKHPGLISFRMDWLDLDWIDSLWLLQGFRKLDIWNLSHPEVIIYAYNINTPNMLIIISENVIPFTKEYSPKLRNSTCYLDILGQWTEYTACIHW